MLKILQLCKFFPPHFGGIETVSNNLMMDLTSLELPNTVLAFGLENSYREHVDTMTKSKCSIFVAKSLILLGSLPLSFHYFRTYKKIKKDYDVLIVHLPNPFAAICILLSGFNGNVLLYWHSDVVNKGIMGYFLTPIEILLIKRADAVLAPTIAHINSSKYSKLFKFKSHVVSYPVDRSILDCAKYQRNIPKVISKPVRILAIGRLVEYKGLSFLIRAVSLLNFDFKLDIIGDGPLRSSLINLVYDLNLSHKVFIHGSISDAHREVFLMEANIFCLPSVSKAEMFGMVQLEAMAHGIPVISTDIQGSGVAIFTLDSGGGVVVEPSNSVALAKAINKLVSNPSFYNKLSMSGIDNLITNLSIENTTKKSIDICLRIDCRY
jgi:glycosyltransferase involved in cell wall biosynthesis